MKKVALIEVKRCFLISNLVKAPQRRKRYLGLLSPQDFKKRLQAAKKKVLGMSEEKLNILISPDYPRRLHAYNACVWYIRTFKTTELGVWKRAGSLPLAWTRGSLADTAREVKKAFESNPRIIVERARHAIPNILASNVADLQSEKYLLPIAFQADTGTRGRRGLPTKLKGDLDDGCMRSVALAVHGKKTIKVYFGVPIKKRH